MADRKAVNKYYPPDWTPQQGSINKYNGSHPLRERARKLHEGILIIRFEMPYNIWCGGCGNHIGMGVRYNAEKRKVGNYYSTPIYQFRMKCHLCDNHFEMKTDPQNFDYVVVSGARRQEGRWDPTQNEQVAPDDSEVKKQLATNAMYKLEHGVTDKGKSSSVAPTIAELEALQDRWKDDYTSNQLLRQRFRDKKKELKAAEERDKGLLQRASLSLNLVDEHPDDIYLASLLKLTPLHDLKDAQKKKREEIESRPLFGSSSSSSTTSDSRPLFGTSSSSASHSRSARQSQLTELAAGVRRSSAGVTGGSTLSGVKLAVRRKQTNPRKLARKQTSNTSTATAASVANDTALQLVTSCYDDLSD